MHYNLGAWLEQQGKRDAAVVQYAELARLLPGSAEAQYQWGRVLAAQGRYEDAIARFEEALRLNPRLAQASDSLSLARAEQHSLRQQRPAPWRPQNSSAEMISP